MNKTKLKKDTLQFLLAWSIMVILVIGTQVNIFCETKVIRVISSFIILLIAIGFSMFTIFEGK